MSEMFFDELGLPKPKYHLECGSNQSQGLHGKQTAMMLERIEQVLLKDKPDVVIGLGDTDTVLASVLASVKLHIPFAHVEAGLRSYYRVMPEEINRIVADHISDYLFCPTIESAGILCNEGIPKKNVYIVGNTIVDVVNYYKEITTNKIQIECGVAKKGYFLITLHRPENVDDKESLQTVFNTFDDVYKKYHVPMILPLHPRTKSMIEKYGIKIPDGIKVIDPVGFIDMLSLEQHSILTMCDSGSVQEEVCILQVPCVTLRDNTERPESVNVGANIIAGIQSTDIINAIEKSLIKRCDWQNPFGDGKSGETIVKKLLEGKGCVKQKYIK